MKIICAWCQKTIAATCPHCGSNLQPSSVLGPSIPHAARNLFACVAANVVILLYTQEDLDSMPVSHGMCDTCAALTKAEREKRLAISRHKNHTLPSAEELQKIAYEKRTKEDAEAERKRQLAITRQKNNPLPSAEDLDKIAEEQRIKEATEKRGPTGVPQGATTRAEDDRNKSRRDQ